MKRKSEAVYEATERYLEPSVAEFVGRIDAPLRHQGRVEETMEAARKAASTVEGGGDQVAATLLLLDLVGIGGYLDCEGAGTTRLPCFRPLGKGRKQAADGGVWMAAAAAAFWKLYQIICEAADNRWGLVLCPTPNGVGWAYAGEDPHGILTVDGARRAGALQQMRALSRLAIWVDAHRIGIVKSPPPSQREGEFDVLVDGYVATAAPSWERLLVRLDEELAVEAARKAAPCPDASVDTVN